MLMGHTNGRTNDVAASYDKLGKLNVDAQSENEQRSQASAEPACPRLSDELVRKKRELRRHLQDLSSLPFDDPVLAAELADLVSTVLFGKTIDQDRRHWLFKNTGSVRAAVDAAVSRREKAIEMLRLRIAEGMNATKPVTVWDREGIRHSVAIPDQAARHRWARLSAVVENLFPDKNDPNNDMLPHDAAQAMELERMCGVEDKLSRLNAMDRFAVSNLLLKLKYLTEDLRDIVIARKLGKPITEFEKEVEQDLSVEMQQLLASVVNQDTANEGKN